jgi:hypothetical protein
MIIFKTKQKGKKLVFISLFLLLLFKNKKHIDTHNKCLFMNFN